MNGYVLPTEKFKQREKVFGIYRDMSSERSIAKLCVELKYKHPQIAVSRSSLERWSKPALWGITCEGL